MIWLKSFCLWLLVAAAAFLLAPQLLQAAPPNVLIVMADDCTFNDLPLYGGQNARTPNIDQLAKDGLTFNRCYLSEAMCQPCRAELYTGQYPLTNGCAWNHSASRPDAKSLPDFLRPLGYRVGIAGKVHVKPNKAFSFEKIGGFDPSCVRAPTRAHDLGPVTRFMTRDENQPFCLVIALVEPHVPWVMGDASQYPVDQLKLPPNLADTPETRRDFAKYLAEITYMDGQVGEILAVLDKNGLSDKTLVLFTSEQGSQFPGNKWTNWDTGLHSALIARWPGHVPANQRTDAIVQYNDIAPTLVELAGGNPRSHRFDGSSFLPVLLGDAGEHRQFAFGIHNNVPEGPPYPIRTVTDGRYRYIRNLRPDEIFIEKHLMGVMGGSRIHNPYWTSWPREALNNEHTYALVKRYMVRPSVQLYDTQADPYEMSNLAGTPELAQVERRLAAELDRWMGQQRDPGAPEDTLKALQAARRGEHLYGPRR